MTHKWTDNPKHAKSEMEIEREWKMIRTQKHFWLISKNIELRANNFLIDAYNHKSQFSVIVELNNTGPPPRFVAKLSCEALVKSCKRVFEVDAFLFQIIGMARETDNPE